MEWKKYEADIFEYFQTKHPNALIKRNVRLPGKLSGTPREIDILIDSHIFGFSIQIAIECKNWNSKLDVADIGSFIDKLKDVQISKGIIISRLGYSVPAYERAKKEIELQLQVLDFDNLPDYYGFWGNAYRGNVGALISAPNGWVVDNLVPEELLNRTLCTIHPFELSSYEAEAIHRYMYFQITPIKDEYNLLDIFRSQDEVVKEKDKGARIEYWMERITKGDIVYRKIVYKANNYTEFTGGIQFQNVIAYCVLDVQNDFRPDDLARLKYVMNELLILKLDNVNPLDSHHAWRELLGE